MPRYSLIPRIFEMVYVALRAFKTKKSEYRAGDRIETSNEFAIRPLIEQGVVRLLLDEEKAAWPITVQSWLERLPDSEREIFNERIKKFDGTLPRELAV
jgi:hypothetical protein